MTLIFPCFLRRIFDSSEQFEVTNVFNSIDAFSVAFFDGGSRQDWISDLIVADLLSGEDVNHDSLSVLLELRLEGFKFALLLMSGLNLGRSRKNRAQTGRQKF